MKPKEFEITLKLKVEADNLTVAECLATAIVNDLLKCGEEYVDRPINHVRWQRIQPVFEKSLAAELHRVGCPGCINCGPPIMVKADDGCDGRLV